MKNDIKHIHMLGICGTGMGSLAGLLKTKGYNVTGTDQAVYPPMSTQLEELGIKPFIGFDPKNLNKRPDLVIVGNVIRKDNPEVRAAIENGIPYLSMPQAVAELFLKNTETIVVTGTHGKTTTANIIAWLLENAGKDPSFLIGGVGLNFGRSFRYKGENYFVIEGDEYDTAFFDKGSKFLHYSPKNAIISSIEFDHADIFKDLGEIKESFSKFLSLIPADGICAVNGDSSDIADILSHAKCRIVSYGFSGHSDYQIDIKRIDRNGTCFSLTKDGKEIDFAIPMAGRHNVLNAAASVVLLMEMGFDSDILNRGLAEFKGVKRRQEIRDEINSIIIIDDFAHHPTAIRETVSALKARYKEDRLWAIFEPRSNTTRRKVFEKELSDAFEGADKVIIANVFHPEAIPANERLNPENVAVQASKKGIDAYYINDVDFIVEFVVRNVLPGDIIVIMSNGAFGGIHEKIIDGIKKRKFKV